MDQEALQSSLELVRSIAAKRQSEFSEQIANKTEEMLDDLRKTPLRVVLIGPFSSGKSSLLNALIGRQVLPVGLPETTATSFQIRVVGQQSEEGIETPDGKMVPLDKIEDINTNIAQMVNVYVSSDTLPKGFLFLDTPGISSVHQIHESITIDALEKADVILLVVTAEQGMTRELHDFIQNNPRYASKAYLILNKTDLLPRDRREEILNHNKEVSLGIGIERVLIASAKDEPGPDSLKVLLEELVPKAQELKLEAYYKRARATAKHVLNTLNELMASLSLDTDEIDKRIRENERKRTKVLRDIRRKTTEVMANIRQAAGQALDNFEREAYGSVDAITDKVINAQSGTPFMMEIKSIWEREATLLMDKIKKELKGYEASLSDVLTGVDISIPWWINWVEMLVVVLTTIILPWSGLWTLLEGLLGDVIGKALKNMLLKSTVRSSLNTAIQKVSTQLRNEVNSKLDEFRDRAEEYVKEEMEPLLHETEDALSELRSRKQKEVFNFEEEKRSLEQDISALKNAFQLA